MAFAPAAAQELRLIAVIAKMPRSWLSGGAVLLLHVLIVAALLHAIVLEPLFHAVPHETVLSLLTPVENPKTAGAVTSHGNGSGGGAVFQPEALHFENPAPSAGALGLGQALFGCNLENRRNLTDAERAQCDRISQVDLAKMKDGLPLTVKPPGPEWAGLRNSDLRARERNTSDPCQAAKATRTECIHEVLYGKGLW